jgi:hypothetical protein
MGGVPDDEECCKDWREASAELGQRDVRVCLTMRDGFRIDAGPSLKGTRRLSSDSGKQVT